jgi:predicted permease
MDTLLQDVRYAARKLMRTPAFTVVAVTTLTLAIGATTAIFSIVDGVLLKPLPYSTPAVLVLVSSTNKPDRGVPMSIVDFIDYRAQSKSFVGMAAVDNANVNLTADGVQPQRLTSARVGASFFDLLGIPMQLGRGFAAGEDALDASRTVVLSDGMWRGRFAGDPRILGQKIELDGNAYTVVGVASPKLRYPGNPDIWTPFVFQTWELAPENRGSHSMYAIGRLKPGVTVEAARNELRAIAARLETQYPTTNTNFGGTAEQLQQQIVGNVKPALYAMFGAVAFVLLIACANVANLLLVRAASRESEIAVRTALGAGRFRLVRQLVTESVLVAVAGAVLGAALAAWAVDAVVAFAPRELPRVDEIAVNGRVLLFTAATAMVTGMLFGLVPALHAARSDISQMLRESTRGSGRGAQRTRSMLVVTETALAVVLLVGAGLLIRSFVRLIHVDPGFLTENVVSFNITLPQTKYQYDRDVIGFVKQLDERLRRVPGTQEVGVTFGRPLENFRMRTGFDVEGRPPAAPGKRTVTEVHPASSTFFRSLGIKLVRGRLYTAAEDRGNVPGTVVVSQEFVKRYFPNEDPLGKRITLGISHDTAEVGKGSVTAGGEIIGVVADIKQFGLAGDAYPMAYVPFNPLPFQDMSVLVRSSADPQLVESAIRTQVRELDANLPLYNLTTMAQAVSSSVAQPRFYMVLLSAFAGVALLLAAIGIYGVISYAVSLRTRELGIRIALGATGERVVRLVLRQGLWMTGLGVLAGLAAAFWLTRVISGLVFGVGLLDPFTFAAVSVTLVSVAALASFLPARKAARVDPVIAMRAE